MKNTGRWWLAIIAVFAVIIYSLSSILLPFVAGMVAAYFLNPLVHRLERLGVSRTLSTVIITLIFFLLIATAAALLLPMVEEQIAAFIDHVPDYRHSLEVRFGPMVNHWLRQLSHKDFERLQGALGEHAGVVAQWALEILGSVLKGGLALMDILSLMFIMPIVTFYLLRDWEVLVAKVDGWLPKDHAEIIRGRLIEIDQTLSAFVRGQALVCLILGAYYGLALSVAGIELGLVIGLLAGLLSFVPYLGMLSGLMVAMAMAFAQTGEWTLPAIVAGLFAIGHLAESNFLTPRLVGNRVGLHPLWVMFALMSGGALVGLVGLLLAVPVAAIAGVIIRYVMARYLESPLYGGTERM